MDRLTTISASFFMAADIFAIISLATPDWIVTDVGGNIRLSMSQTINIKQKAKNWNECECDVLFFSLGETRLGLMWTCMTLYNRPQVCFTPELQPEWLLALICIFVGCICITTAIILLASSNWDRDVIPYARWVGFTASKLLNAFPIRFTFLTETHLLNSN